MKKIKLLVANIWIISIKVSILWVIMEFILYCVKDKDFNWWSVLVFWLIVGLSLVFEMIVYGKILGKRVKSLTDLKNIQPKSKFAQRLDKLSQKQTNK